MRQPRDDVVAGMSGTRKDQFAPSRTLRRVVNKVCGGGRNGSFMAACQIAGQMESQTIVV